ncbi:hypothetical protein PAE9249_01346 [Paenibacillus sp. CECT 9249]|nr:hypothetical protein PAE9249_01346 [Paenibacillus sp. CECT 9249]
MRWTIFRRSCPIRAPNCLRERQRKRGAISNRRRSLQLWLAATAATIAYRDRELVLTVGSAAMTLNGSPIAIDAPPFVQQTGNELKTYVPLRVLADGLGFSVESGGQSKIVFINQ